MRSEVSEEFDRMGVLARRTQIMFSGAIALSGMLTLDVALLGDRSAGQLESAESILVPLLLWCLMVAAYAFHALWRANSRMAEHMGEIVAADRAQAEQRLRAIRSRLNWATQGGAGRK
jgi:hypothetical protein